MNTQIVCIFLFKSSVLKYRVKQQQMLHCSYKYGLCCNMFMLLRACFCISVVRELAELHKANVSRASEAEEAALNRDTQVKEQLSLALEKAQEEARIQQEALANQVTRCRHAPWNNLFALLAK